MPRLLLLALVADDASSESRTTRDAERGDIGFGVMSTMVRRAAAGGSNTPSI